MDTTALFLGLIFGSTGLGYLVYGKKQKKGIPFISGLLLCGMPYAVSNIWLLAATGITLIVLPFIVRN